MSVKNLSKFLTGGSHLSSPSSSKYLTLRCISILAATKVRGNFLDFINSALVLLDTTDIQKFRISDCALFTVPVILRTVTMEFNVVTLFDNLYPLDKKEWMIKIISKISKSSKLSASRFCCSHDTVVDLTRCALSGGFCML